MEKIKYPPCADGDRDLSGFVSCMRTQDGSCKFKKDQIDCPTYRVNISDCHWEVIKAGYTATLYMLQHITIVVISSSDNIIQVQGEELHSSGLSGYEGALAFLEAIDKINNYCMECGAYYSNEFGCKCETCSIYKNSIKNKRNKEENMPEKELKKEQSIQEMNDEYIKEEERRKELDKKRLTQGYKRFSEIANDSIFSAIRYLLPHTTTLQEIELITDDIVSILESIHVKELKKHNKED